MSESKPSRDKIKRALRDLSGSTRFSGRTGLFEVFPFGDHLGVGVSEAFNPANYDDRAMALICGAALDNALETVLSARLIALTRDEEREVFYREGAPLATMASRIVMAYALGVIGPAGRDDLNMMRAVRNAFAHSRHPITFDSPEIAQACAAITLPDRSEMTASTEGPCRRYVETAIIYTVAMTVAAEKGQDANYRLTVGLPLTDSEKSVFAKTGD